MVQDSSRNSGVGANNDRAFRIELDYIRNIFIFISTPFSMPLTNQRKLLLRYLILFIFVCLSVRVAAQNNLIPEDSLPTSDYVYHQIDGYKTHLKKIADNNAAPLDKKIQKQYQKIIEDKNSDMIDRLNGGEFLFDSTIYPYLYGVFKNVVEANGLDINTFHFFVSRSLEVNAYTYEDGTIVCNLGLLNIIENESQLAMIFSHELSHYLLKHSNIAITKYLETLNSDELLAQLKDIQKGIYNTKEQMENLMMADVFNRRKHSRSQETSADSSGMILFSKTGYNSSSLPRIFDLFDSCQINVTPICTMRTFFNNEGIATDDNWFTVPKRMSFGAATKKEIIDSLKTHPDCAKRKTATLLFFSQHPKSGIDFIIGNKAQLCRIKNIAFFDEATFIKNQHNLGGYLYQLIQNDTEFPSNTYIKTEIFNTLLSLCNHQKSHTLYVVVAQPYIPDDDKDEYAKLLKIIDNVDLKKLIEITASYYDKNKDLIHTTNESINNLNQLKKM
jgi:hypothetical protein